LVKIEQTTTVEATFTVELCHVVYWTFSCYLH